MLCAAQRDSLLALPTTQDELIRHQTFTDNHLALILSVPRQFEPLRLRGTHGLIAVSRPRSGRGQRGDGAGVAVDAHQLRIDAVYWPKYAERQETPRKHLIELRAYLGLAPFGLRHFRQATQAPTEDRKSVV